MSDSAQEGTLFAGMLRTAAKGGATLGKSSALVRSFFLAQQNPDGGYRDRSGNSDLYYSVFGLAGIAAVSRSPLHAPGVLRVASRLRPWIERLGDGAGLDLVHLCALARVWAGLKHLGKAPGAGAEEALLRRLERYRSLDGGYYPVPGSRHGTPYGAFLAFGAYQDLGVGMPDPARFVDSVQARQASDGAWSNQDIGPAEGGTNATAAAVSVLCALGRPVARAQDWLLNRAHSQGGFRAAPRAPFPDLLSTATALHALALMNTPVTALREKTLDFMDSLWSNQGGFHGHWGDDFLDCEYTFYGLLALGHLA